MLITNHVLAGSIIGISVKEPILAIIAAFISHFLMDALPHFGYPGKKGYPEVLKHNMSYYVGLATLISTLGVVFFLITNKLWFPLICGLTAASPDIAGWYNYAAYEKKGELAKGILKLFHVQFHRGIQNFERPWGIYLEVIIAVILFSAVLNGKY